MTKTHARTSTTTTFKLFARQKQLLQLLDALGGSAGKLDFQNLLFLYCQDLSAGAPYDFVPYEFGPFSFTSDADRRKLVERGLLVDDEHSWQLTNEARCMLGGTGDLQLTAFARRYRSLRGKELVASISRRFPFFAMRSDLAGRMHQDDCEALPRLPSTRTGGRGRALQTIGYQGHTLESYLNLLLEGGITVLCDVRHNPISRKYGFSKSTLARSCEGVGLRYQHLPELGIASDQRRGLATQADYAALFAEYEKSWLPTQSDALENIRDFIASGERVALTCFEHLPVHCHRRCVAEALETRFGKDFAPTHL